jgi:adenylosuccinate lyase
MSREEAYRIVQRNAHTAWNTAGGDFRANLESDADVAAHLSENALNGCFSTEVHQENLEVIWNRLGI